MSDTADSASSGRLNVTISDNAIEVGIPGGALHTIPVGPVLLGATEFGGFDPPPPACLTNALGLVHDHLDDIVAESSDVAGATTICFRGHHARSLACVEVGRDLVAGSLTLRRSDIEEVFRTLVVETTSQRRTNPGLDDHHADTIIATCCVVLAIMRRLALTEATFADDTDDTDHSNDADHTDHTDATDATVHADDGPDQDPVN